MSVVHKRSFAMIGFVFGLFLATSLFSSGCTLGECTNDEREICVGSECACGDKCGNDSHCEKTEKGGKHQADNPYINSCFGYENEEKLGGVCVDKDFKVAVNKIMKKQGIIDFSKTRHLPEKGKNQGEYTSELVDENVGVEDEED